MALALDQRLSANFTFAEMVASETAERSDTLVYQQQHPREDVEHALLLLCQTTLQPIRDMIQSSVVVQSGYRSPEVNRMVGGSDTSAHVKGEAADITLPPGGFFGHVKNLVHHRTEEIIGKKIRENVNRNYYLFALICINLERLDADQVIHEYGPCAGKPAWVHVSSSERQDKRQILVIGRYTETRVLTIKEALELGV